MNNSHLIVSEGYEYCVVCYEGYRYEYVSAKGACKECDMVLCSNKGGPYTQTPDLGCSKLGLSNIWKLVKKSLITKPSVAYTRSEEEIAICSMIL